MKKKIVFNQDYYLSIIKPIREELTKQVNKQIGKVKKNKNNTYTATLEEWEIDAIDKITDGLWKGEAK